MTCLVVTSFVIFGVNPSPAWALTAITPEIESQVIQIIRAYPEIILESVEHYQKAQYEEQQREKQKQFEQFKAEPEKFIAESPISSEVSNKVILFEFSDFQCPYCASVHKTLSKFIDKHGDRVVLVYKHYPLEIIHPEAVSAAKATWAAAQQNKFWEYHDMLFKRQKRLGEPFFKATAQRLHLDLDKFNRDRNSAEAEAAIEKDIQLANQLGIESTPSFVMQGQIFSGAVKLSELEEMLVQVN